MTNYFNPHHPNWMEVTLDKSDYHVPFNSLDELLEIDCVKSFVALDGFSHLEKSGRLIMAIYYDGFSWRVIGDMETNSTIDLKEWDGGKQKLKLSNGDVITLPSEDYPDLYVQLYNSKEILLSNGESAKPIEPPFDDKMMPFDDQEIPF